MNINEEKDFAAELEAIRSIVNRACSLTLEDLEWLPLYPNGMKENHQCGIFCLIPGRDETSPCRRYTILFQYKAVSSPTDLLQSMTDEIEMYILFERLADPSADPFSCEESNDKGSFIRAYTDLESAQKRVLVQYKAVYGYAMSFLLAE